MKPIYPGIRIRLSGLGGNAFVIIAECRKAMRKNGFNDEAVEKFTTEARSGDYDKVLRTVMKYFTTH
ncbi:MAG: hypothetical protein ABL951_02730 [Alphaproteobacteria bacterium]